MKNIIITNVLDYQHGGRTKSLIQRANMLSKNAQDVEILFTGLDATLETKFKYFHENGIIDSKVKLTSMWAKFREQEVKQKYNFTERIEQELYKAVVKPIELGKVQDIIYKYRNNSRMTAFTDVLDPDGYLFRRKFYVFNKLTKSTFYNQAGESFLEFHYLDGKTQVITTNKQVTTYDDYKAEFFKTYLQDKGINIIMDARKEDANLLKCNFEKNQVFFVFHSSHTNMQGKTHAGYLNIIKQSKENYKIITLTEEQKNDIENHEHYNGCEVIVIGHPLTIVKNKSEVDSNRYVIVSRIEKSKQVLDAVKAFELFVQDYPNKKLEIYGHGTEEATIIQYIEQNNLSNNITLNGYTNNPLKQYETSYASIITTQFEGFGMAMAECLSVGCPVIAYKFKYGQKDMIMPGKNGFITQENTVESLYKLICETRDKRQSRKKIRKSIDKYNINNITKLWIEALNNKDLSDK